MLLFLEFPCVLQSQEEKYMTLWKLRSVILGLQGGILKFRNINGARGILKKMSSV